MQNKPSLTRGYVIAVTGATFWATTAIFIGYLSTHYKLPPLVLAFWRDLFVVIGLLVGLRLLSPRLLVLPQARKHLVFFVIYGFILAIFNSLWTMSVALNGAAVATVLAYSSPGFTAILGRWLFGEKLGAAKIIAVCLSITGCALVSGAYNPAAWQVNPIGIAVGLLGGIAFAVYSIMGKASSRRGIEAWTTMLYAFSFGAFFLLLMQRPDTILWLGSSAAGWGTLLLLALVPTIGGYGLYTVSLTYLPASVANLIATLEPPMTAVMAFFLLGEQMSGVQLLGGGVILLGVLVLRASDFKFQIKRRYYPGTDENPFHLVLMAFDKLARIPMLAMPLWLALISALAGLPFFHFPPSTFRFLLSTLLVFIFSLSDLVLLSALPRLRRSYGPPQPPALLMSIARAMVALVIGALAWIGLPFVWALWLNVAAQVAGTLLAVEAYWFGPYRLGVTHATLRSPKLDAAAPPLRVLHLADLHVERLTARERKLIEQINDLHPDAILFSGDFLNLSCVNDPRAQAECRAFLAQLHAPLGVYAVTGSIPVDTPAAVHAVLDGMSIRRLDNQRVTLSKNGQSLDVIGLTCTHHPEWDAGRLDTLIRHSERRLADPRRSSGASDRASEESRSNKAETLCSAQGDNHQNRFCVLLYHTPDLAPEAAQLGVDLQLSGHTHGGQVRLPIIGALFTSSLYGKQFEMGKYQVGPMTLYVSRGIGMEGRGAPRVRFLCPPEIVLWEIGGPS